MKFLKRFSFVAIFLALFSTLSVWAQETQKEKKVPKKIGIDSDTVKKNLDSLFDSIEWATGYEETKTKAQKDGKPIFFIHSKGDLNGIT